jgi:hypothetical protein
MKRFKQIAIFVVILMAAGALSPVGGDASAQVPRMTKEELKDLLCKTDVIVIDVRQPGQWDASKLKIKGAHREDPGKKAESWAMKYPKDRTIVLY